MNPFLFASGAATVPLAELRVAAAEYVLCLLDGEEIPRLVERLVDADMITPTVADLYLARESSLSDRIWKFARMLRELHVALPEAADAVHVCFLHGLRLLAEGIVEPDVGARRLLFLHRGVRYGHLERVAKDWDILQRIWDIGHLSYDYEPWDGVEPAAERRRRGNAAVLALDKELTALQQQLHLDYGPALDPTWLESNGGNVVKLAEAIRAERAFDRLPILADALEETGCLATDILEHCRYPGPHKDNCWVIDLLLNSR